MTKWITTVFLILILRINSDDFMMDYRGKLVFQDGFLKHPGKILDLILYFAGICLFSITSVLAIYYGWNSPITFIVVSLMSFNILFVTYRIGMIIKSVDYRIYENGFVLPGRFGRPIFEKGFISFDDVQNIKFYSWGLGIFLYMNNGKTINIVYTEGEKPFRIIADLIINKFNPKEIPDYSFLDNWKNYKTKIDRKTAMLKHMEINRRFK